MFGMKFGMPIYPDYPQNCIDLVTVCWYSSFNHVASACEQGVGLTLQWRHNERNGVSNHRRFDCLLNRLFRRRSKKTSKLRVTGLCEGNSPVTSDRHCLERYTSTRLWLNYLSPVLPSAWTPAVNWARLQVERHATGVVIQWTWLPYRAPD